MANFPSIVNTATSIMRGVSKTQMVRDLNRVEAEMSNATTVFLDSLKTNRETSTYLDLMKDTLYSQYDEYIEAIDNPMAKSQMTGALDTIKTETKSKVMALMAKNGQVFGSQELKVELEELASRGPDATEAMVGDNSYLFDRATRIGNKISLAGGGGFVTSTQARDLNAKYITSLHKNHTRLLYNEALTTMITGGMPELEAVELVEQVMRSKGGELEDIIKGTDLSGIPAISPLGAQRLSALAKGWEAVVLGSDEQETLINNMRNRGKRISDANSEKEKVELEVNDLKLTELWATGAEGRYEMMEDNYAMLYKIYDSGTSEGRTEIAKWMKDLGNWSIKLEQEVKREDAKRKYDIDIQNILDNADSGAIADTISNILNDEDILDAERDQMVSTLNSIKESLDSGEVPTGGVDRAEEYRAEYDTKILDIQYAVMAGEAGVVDKIKNLITELQGHEYFKGNEQDRNERTAKLMGFIKELGTKAVSSVGARSNISEMLSDPVYSRKEISDEIRRALIAGEIDQPGESVLRNELANRQEKYLDDLVASTAVKTVARHFNGAVNNPNIDPEERAVLGQEQITAENGLNQLLDDEAYRMADPIKRKEMLDDIMADILSPSISRSLAQRFLGLITGGNDERPDLYEQFQNARSESYQSDLQGEVREEWFIQLSEGFSNLSDDVESGKFQAKRTLVDDKYIIELLHTSSGTLLTQRGGKWYAKIRGKGEYMEVKNRLSGEDTKSLLEAL